MEPNALASADWQVHKFGGTSLANPDRIERVASLLDSRDPPWAVVVSAMSGVTDRLLDLGDRAAGHRRGGLHRSAAVDVVVCVWT